MINEDYKNLEYKTPIHVIIIDSIIFIAVVALIFAILTILGAN